MTIETTDVTWNIIFTDNLTPQGTEQVNLVADNRRQALYIFEGLKGYIGTGDTEFTIVSAEPYDPTIERTWGRS